MRTCIDRLQKRADFLRVARAGRKWVTASVMIQVAPQPLGVESRVRVGFTASRKVGNAVVRNRARRRLRAAVDRLFLRHAACGLDYVLVARRNTAICSWTSLLAEIESALKRLRLWRAKAEPDGTL